MMEDGKFTRDRFAPRAWKLDPPCLEPGSYQAALLAGCGLWPVAGASGALVRGVGGLRRCRRLVAVAELPNPNRLPMPLHGWLPCNATRLLLSWRLTWMATRW